MIITALKSVIPCLLLFTACAGNNNTIEDDASVVMEDSLDYISEVNDSLEFPIEIDTVNENLKALLDNPIDLPDFKEKYGPSNGGGGGNEVSFDIPDTSGQLYAYFLFYKLSRALPSRPSEGTLFNNFTITVYRKGEGIGDFYDHEKDHLLMIESALDNTVIGELNWYGKSEDELLGAYGAPHHKSGDVWLYYHENRVMSCGFSSGKVSWYKYARLNKELDLPSELPGFLLKF